MFNDIFTYPGEGDVTHRAARKAKEKQMKIMKYHCRDEMRFNPHCHQTKPHTVPYLSGAFPFK